MDGKQQITIEQHHAKSKKMDELCDANDFDGIISICRELVSYTHSSALIRLHIYYNIGSGYSHVASRRDNQFGSKTSGLALLNFRKAMAEASLIEQERFTGSYTQNEILTFDDLKSRLQTNLANELDYQGRRLEALAAYEHPIKSGNVYAVMGRARCVYRLAESVYDGDHAFYLYRESARCYEEALARINEFAPIQRAAIQSDPFFQHFLNWFQQEEQKIGSDYAELEDLPGTMFDTRKEQEYFAWCAEHRLFVNELNVISTAEVVNHDILSLPDFLARINPLLTSSEELGFHGHFDELKTDYCYARYLAYMGSSIPLSDEHFFNSTFEHVDTLDYEINNLKTNHLKSCFRINYSIFDKISFFLHRFYKIDGTQNDHKVDFKTLWFKPGNQHLKDMFENSDNEHFRALYFLSHEIRQGNRNTPEDEDLSYWFDPDTQRLFRIRNAMEHRSLKLVDNFCHRHVGHFSNDQDAIDNHVSDIDRIRSELEQLLKAKLKDPSSDLDNQILALEKRIVRLEQDLDEKNLMSNYALVIGVEEFEKLTLKLLTLAKDALLYLSLAIHHEEMKKPQDGLVIPKLIPKK